MPSFDPETIQAMKSAMDAIMAKVPEKHTTTEVKLRVAECICKSAGEGITTFDGLVTAVNAHFGSSFFLSSSRRPRWADG
jgi:hypothetical protein